MYNLWQEPTLTYEQTFPSNSRVAGETWYGQMEQNNVYHILPTVFEYCIKVQNCFHSSLNFQKMEFYNATRKFLAMLQVDPAISGLYLVFL